MNEKRPSFQWPNASCMWNSKEFLVYEQIHCRTAHDVGLLVQQIAEDLLDGRFDNVLKYRFIDKVFKGHKARKSLPLHIKRKVLEIGLCNHCGTDEKLTVDHIIPISKGGGDDLINLQCLCWNCNRLKGPECNGRSRLEMV